VTFFEFLLGIVVFSTDWKKCVIIVFAIHFTEDMKNIIASL
jgi:hypothetical protein